MRGNGSRTQEQALRDSQAAVFWLGGDPRWQPPGIRPLDHTVRTDVCIVGGGFSGLWTAFWVKRLSKDTQVVLIEREFCGAGASGRNGGWVNGWEDSIDTLLNRFGQASAKWLVEASLAGVDTMRQVVAEGDIDCDLAFNGGLEIAMSGAQKASLDESLLAAERIGLPELLAPLSKEEAREACGSMLAEGGVRITRAGSVQPALLVQGLRRLAIEAGVQVFEATPLTRLNRTVPAVVETPAGSVIADQVVLTCGPWLARLRELRRTLFVIPSHVIATAPAPELLEATGWRHGQPFVDYRTAVHYGQRTADDRLVFGRGGGRLGFAGRIIPEHFHDVEEVQAIVADLHAMLPASREMVVEWHWGGPVERTQHGTPWVGTLGTHGNIHYGTGYSGNGVCPSQLIGRTLASVALRLDDEHASSPLVSEPPSYLPPEPVRSIGARAVRAAIARSEEQADQGRVPGRLTRLVSRGLDFSMPRGVSARRDRRSDVL
jgi:glycine/D-amino acid oxidase-like deaminating enzyme